MSLDPIASRLAATGWRSRPRSPSAARRHGLDPELLAAVAAQETGGPGSNAGAQRRRRRRSRPRPLPDRRPLARLRLDAGRDGSRRKTPITPPACSPACSSATAATSARRSRRTTRVRPPRPEPRRAGRTAATLPTPTPCCATTARLSGGPRRRSYRRIAGGFAIAESGATHRIDRSAARAARSVFPMPLPSPSHSLPRTLTRTNHASRRITVSSSTTTPTRQTRRKENRHVILAFHSRRKRLRASSASNRLPDCGGRARSVRASCQADRLRRRQRIAARSSAIAELERAHLVARLALGAGAEPSAQPADAAGLPQGQATSRKSTDYTQFVDDSN